MKSSLPYIHEEPLEKAHLSKNAKGWMGVLKRYKPSVCIFDMMRLSILRSLSVLGLDGIGI